MATRFNRTGPVLASLLICSILRAEPHRPDAKTPNPPVTPSRASALPSTVTFGSDSAGCSVSGNAIPPVDVQLLDADARPIARFGGVAVPLALTDFPERSDGNIQVTTGGHGRLRLSGVVPIRSIPLFLRQDLPIVSGRVTLLKGTAAEYRGVSGKQIRIRVKTAQGLAESYELAIACDALTVEVAARAKWAPPTHARGYLMKQPVAQLYDKPNGEAQVVASLHLAPEARGLLVYGDRREGDFVHVLYHRDVAIDGWLRAADLEILPRGELADQSSPKPERAVEKRLQLKTEGPIRRVENEILLYGRADPKLPAIGSVPKDTELYVLDVVVGWANVLPKQLDVVPLNERHFWVKAAELGM